MDSSVVKARVLHHEYRDSMVLMYLSARMEKLPGVIKAAAIMGTEADKTLLAAMNLSVPEALEAGPNDLLAAVRGTDFESASRALARLEEMLAQRVTAVESGEIFCHSIEGAVQALPGANLALISVPGMYAAREARKALDLGLHVFLFFDHVSLEEEVALKRSARERGLLVMGPDCGTALIGGLAVGFANAVRRGRVGIVGASGTGIQEVSVLLHRAGLGVSHALGTGGKDLSAEVGAITTLQAVELLEKDRETDVLVILSKKPAPEVLPPLRSRLKSCPKPVVACFLGQAGRELDPPLHRVSTLAEAAQTAARVAGCLAGEFGEEPAHLARQAGWESRKLRPDQRYVRGLFSGGSLCQEALLLWQDLLGPVESNVPLPPGKELPDAGRSSQHAALDLGDDFFTAGRPHPMIDPAARRERLLHEADDPSVAVIVLDVVLGYGSHPDMAGALLPAIQEARSRLRPGEDTCPLSPMWWARKRIRRMPGHRRTSFGLRGSWWLPPMRMRRGSPRSSPWGNERKKTMAEDNCCARLLLKGPPRVVNVGLEWFHRSLQSQGAKTVHVAWRPAAGGNQKLAALLDRLSGRKLRE